MELLWTHFPSPVSPILAESGETGSDGKTLQRANDALRTSDALEIVRGSLGNPRSRVPCCKSAIDCAGFQLQ